MKKNMRIYTPSKASEVLAIVIGIVVSSIVSALLSAGLTSFVMNGTVKELTIGPYVFVVRSIATMVGCLIGVVLMRGKYLLIISAVAIGYLVSLLGLGIILYENTFNNILLGVASVVIGGVAACTIVLKPLKKSNHTPKYRR